MIEVYTGSVGKINLITYKDGIPTQPDATPTVSIIDAETNSSVASGNATLIDSDYEGEYEYTLPTSITSTDRILKATWSYSISTKQYSEVEYVYVVTPYATVDEIISELGFSSRPEDANYFSYEKVKSAERTARMIINNELGFSIGKKTKEVTCYGTGADVLYVGEKIISVSSLKENDELVIDNTTNIFGFPIEITETSNAIRIVPNSGDDIDEQETLDADGYNPGRFREGYRYEVSGVFGWNYVPSEIKQCMFLLVNDLLCTESTWRTKYLKKINSGQMSVEISSLSFTGTGNAIVDSLLQQFKNIQVVVI